MRKRRQHEPLLATVVTGTQAPELRAFLKPLSIPRIHVYCARERVWAARPTEPRRAARAEDFMIVLSEWRSSGAMYVFLIDVDRGRSPPRRSRNVATRRGIDSRALLTIFFQTIAPRSEEDKPVRLECNWCAICFVFYNWISSKSTAS